MGDGAGHGDDEVRRPVPLVVEAARCRSRVIAADRLAGAEHLTAERVVREQRLAEEGDHPVVGRVLLHGDLLEDHLALGLDLVGPEGRRPEDVAEDVEPEDELPGREARVVRRVLLGGEGVHLAAHGVDRLGDLGGRAGLGALEQQVLEEVRGAGHGRRLVTSSRRPPRTRS